MPKKITRNQLPAKRFPTLEIEGLHVPHAAVLSASERRAFAIPLGEIVCIKAGAAQGKTSLVVKGIYEISKRIIAQKSTNSALYELSSAAECHAISGVHPVVILDACSQVRDQNLIQFFGLSRALASCYAQLAVPYDSNAKWIRACPEFACEELAARMRGVSAGGKQSFLVGGYFPKSLFSDATPIREFIATFIQAGFARFALGERLLKIRDFSDLATEEELRELLNAGQGVPGVVVLVDSLIVESLTPERVSQSFQSASALSASGVAVVRYDPPRIAVPEIYANAYVREDLQQLRPLWSESTFIEHLNSAGPADSAMDDFLIGETRLSELLAQPLSELLTFLETTLPRLNRLAGSVERLKEILSELNLGHLPAHQLLATVSSGERRKLAIANYLAADLREAIFVIDDAERNFPPSEFSRLAKIFAALQQQGNSVVFTSGGDELDFAATRIIVLQSDVAGAVSAVESARDARQSRKVAALSGARLTVAKQRSDFSDFQIRLGKIHSLLGEIGSGKSLRLKALYQQSCELDRGRRGSALPVYFEHVTEDEALRSQTVLELFDLGSELAELFAAQAGARRAGFVADDFQIEGLCLSCGGSGEQVVAVVAERLIRERCEVCAGVGLKQRAAAAILCQGRNFPTLLRTSVFELRDSLSSERLSHCSDLLMRFGLSKLRLGVLFRELSFTEQTLVRAARIVQLVESNAALVFVEGLLCGLDFAQRTMVVNALRSSLSSSSGLVFTTYRSDEAEMADFTLQL